VPTSLSEATPLDAQCKWHTQPYDLKTAELDMRVLVPIILVDELDRLKTRRTITSGGEPHTRSGNQSPSIV
jgi:hypothetical protein